MDGNQGIPIGSGFTVSKDDHENVDYIQSTLAGALANIPNERRYSGKPIFVLEPVNRGKYYLNATKDGWEQFGASDAGSNLTTGVTSGGEITINADPTKFDIAAGNGIIVDWTDPENPIRTLVAWNETLAQDIPNLLTGLFTTIGVDALGQFEILSGVITSAQKRRTTIRLQSLVHASGVQIDRIANSSQPSFDISQAFLDYIVKLGPINTGNQVTANASDLEIQKDAGDTTFPFINRSNDTQAPTTLINNAISPILFNTIYQDGVGGFTIIPSVTDVDPDFWDDGDGTLAAVPNNQFQIKRIYFFAGSDTIGVSYGQATYGTIEAAEAAIFTEQPVLSPIFQLGTFITALIVQQGATDLSDAGQASFVDVAGANAGAGGGGGGGTPGGSNQQIQFNDSGIFGASALLKWLGTSLLIGDAVTGGFDISATAIDLENGDSTAFLLEKSGAFGSRMVLSETDGVGGNVVKIRLTSDPTLTNYLMKILGLGIITPNTNAYLDITSTTKGFLKPRMTTAQRTTLGTLLGNNDLDKGMEVYDLDLLSSFSWSGTEWKGLAFSTQTINHSVAGALTIDFSKGVYVIVNLTENATSIVLTNPIDGKYQIELIQDATGGRVVSFSGFHSVDGAIIDYSVNADASSLVDLTLANSKKIIEGMGNLTAIA